MIDLSTINDITVLKSEYKKLASRYHPDRGGNSYLMQNLNIEYKNHYSKLKNNLESYSSRNFKNVEVGDTVWVNGTESEVIEVNYDQFRVVAKGRNRQAVFDKNCGIGKYNTRLFASYEYLSKPSYLHH